MARVIVTDFVWKVDVDDALAPVGNAKVYIFAADGFENVNVDPPTGTLVAAFDAFSGGSPLSFPLVTPPEGTWQIAMDSPTSVVAVVTDNGGNAQLPDGTPVTIAPGAAHQYYTPGSTDTFTALFTLTDAPTVAFDGSLGGTGTLITSSNRTIGNPTNLVPGRNYTLVIRNGKLSGTITTLWSANWNLGSAWVDPAATKARAITFKALDATHAIEVSRVGGELD